MKFSIQLALGALLAVPLLAAEFTEVSIKSTKDGAAQRAFWWAPTDAKKKRVPLLVVLHTWSGNYQQKKWKEVALVESEKRDWAVIHPDFRGPNRTPKACASEFAVQDVLDAVAWARTQCKVDESRIYLVGTSGGGHMSLIMAGRAPEIWAGVSAWVPISNLAQWHRDCAGSKFSRYAKEMEKVCGGKPGDSKQVDSEYRKRSPLTYLANAKGVALDINAGIHDGYTGSVPSIHSVHAFNALANANGRSNARLRDAQMKHIREQRKIPAALADERVDEDGRIRKILFRRSAGSARLTLFDGGHEGDMPAAINWLAAQSKK